MTVNLLIKLIISCHELLLHTVCNSKGTHKVGSDYFTCPFFLAGLKLKDQTTLLENNVKNLFQPKYFFIWGSVSFVDFRDLMSPSFS